MRIPYGVVYVKEYFAFGSIYIHEDGHPDFTQSADVGAGTAVARVISRAPGPALGASSPPETGVAACGRVLRPCRPRPHVFERPGRRGFTMRVEPPEPYPAYAGGLSRLSRRNRVASLIPRDPAPSPSWPPYPRARGRGSGGIPAILAPRRDARP